MYAFISGKLDSIYDSGIVIENCGIGYNVRVSNNVISRLPKIGADIKLFTYTHVSEDCFDLYGFLAKEDKAMFLNLIAVSGVGCKLANQILSGADASSLAIAIANKDIAMLSRIKGIGKKTAERIILELKEKVSISDMVSVEEYGFISADVAMSDAVMALVSLGFGKTEAAKAVAKARAQTDKTDILITIALKNIDKA